MVPSDAYDAVKKLRQQVSELNGVGDLAALSLSVEQIEPLIEGHREAYEAKKAAEAAVKAERRAQVLIEKEKIVAEAESLALSENWKVTGDRLKTLLDEWKSAPRLGKKADADLWKRFSASRNKFDKRRAKVEEAIKSAEAEIWRKTDPAAKARAADVVKQLADSIANYEKIAAKSEAAGNSKKAQEALESASARKLWLADAEKALAEFN
jgi:hypothetical protein